MALFDKFARLGEQRRTLFHGGTEPAGVVVERILSPTRAIVGGRETVLFGTNNYLGLTFEPSCIEAGREAYLAGRMPRKRFASA